MFDPSQLAQMMQQAQTMQKKMQDDLGEIVVEAQTGGGMVKVKMNGLGELLELKIEKAAVDPDDVELLEDLVRAAVNQASSNIESKKADQARDLASSMGLPPGMI
ncbi:MAG: YbaB/EbfC family nucleoid-associated protein [Deltaproteobacteria bacterium]|nr:YbaB/EbfC family nucleoid-associated protein [Deltaproteobacteria bacterium]